MEELKTPYVPTWCPGCGDYGILNGLKKALALLPAGPENIALVSGIGCAPKIAQYVNTYRIETLHGRTLPVATGLKLANRNLTVIAEGGDGDGMGLGMGHFIHTARRNLDIAYFIHNNQVYGLTKGQTSPTSEPGMTTKFTPPPKGNVEHSINIVHMALHAGATFVARSFSADPQLADIMVQAVQHKGFAVVDILQPCVSFNKVNSYQWYMDRIYPLQSLPDYDAADFAKAAELATQWGEKIPSGVFYRTERPVFEDSLPQLAGVPLVKQPIDAISMQSLMDELS